MATLSDFKCVDCRVDTTIEGVNEYYMVHDAVWALTGLGKRDGAGMLCIGCLEGRIGRKLNARDFTDAPINVIIEGSERLQDRKNKKKRSRRSA